MSHEVEQMAYRHVNRSNDEHYQIPWHGLGNPINPAADDEDMWNQSGLDFRVLKVPQFIELNGEKVLTGSSVLVRDIDNKILGPSTPNWEIVQNSEMWEFIQQCRKTVQERGSDLEINTAGSLFGGEICWVLARIKDSFFNPVKGDEVQGNLLFTNPHKYGRCTDLRFTGIRVVCNNTLTMALKGNSDLVVRMNHRHKFDPEVALKAIGLASTNMKTYAEAAEFLVSKQYDETSVVKYLQDVFPPHDRKKDKNTLSRPAKLAFGSLETQPGANLATGSWWNAFNAVTYTTDHNMSRTADTRLGSAWYGPNRARKVVALKKALEYAEAA